MQVQQFSDLKTIGLSFFSQISNQLPKITIAIVIFIAFYIGAKITRWLVSKSTKRLHWDSSVKQLLNKVTQTIIVLLGLVTALGTAGVNVSALVASLGLMSFAIGFAFKDLLTNTLAGVLILMYRPFRVGSHISGSNFEGTVSEINLRYIKLSNNDNDILVPNATMLTSVVTVLTAPRSA